VDAWVTKEHRLAEAKAYALEMYRSRTQACTVIQAAYRLYRKRRKAKQQHQKLQKAARAAARAARKSERQAKRAARAVARKAAAAKKKVAALKKKAPKKKSGKKSKAALTPSTQPTAAALPGGGSLLYKKVNAAVAKDQLEITLRLNLNYNNIASNANDLDAFIKAFTHDVARALNIEEWRVVVLAIQHAFDNAGVQVSNGKAASGKRGSKTQRDGVIVRFQILPAKDSPVHSDPKDPKSVENLGTTFGSQTQTSDSELNKSSIMSKIDAGSDVTVTHQQAQGSAASTAAQPTIIALAVSVIAVVAVMAL